MVTRIPSGGRSIDEAVVTGQVALEAGRFEDAVKQFKSALRMAPNPAQEADIRCRLSQALEKKGLKREQLEAVAKYNNTTEYARLPEATRLNLLIRRGWAYLFNDDIPRAIALFNQAMQIARRLDARASIGECYFGLGRAYSVFSEIRIARDHYVSALEHFRRLGDWHGLAESYINIGYISAREGDHQSALNSIKQALAIIGGHEDYDLLGRAHWYLAIVYENLDAGKDKVCASYERCLKYFQRSGNNRLLAVNQNNYAVELIRIGEWDRAEQLLNTAIEVLGDSSGVAGISGALDTLAGLYVLRGNLDEAHQLIDKALGLVSSVKNGEWVELSIQITLGRAYLMKGEPHLAISPLERSIEICERSGDHYYLSHAQLWLSESLLQTGQVERARSFVGSVRNRLRSSPNILVWGLMMRMAAKIETADGRLEAAIQWLGQSTSVFEIKGNVYEAAINCIVLAQLLEKLGKLKQSIQQVERALGIFETLGASADAANARAFLASLVEEQAGAAPVHESRSPQEASGHSGGLRDRATNQAANSLMDAYVAHRMVEASVSKHLLMHELASIASSRFRSRGALVAELSQPDDNSARVPWTIAAATGTAPSEQARDLELLEALAAEEYEGHYVFPFSDNYRSSYLLHLIDPQIEVFLAKAVTLEPLLALARQGLEMLMLKSKTRRTPVFNPARILAEAEIPGFICASRAMSRVLEQIHKIRSSDVTVLITGESGTGKELIARAVHAGSSRRFNLFLPFNCSAAPRDMIESQLFGFRKGAFTGAVENNQGIVRAAEGGTLFLDEIGDLPHELQPKLLRFLQEGEILPLGENQPVLVDVRVVAATNSDLEKLVSEGRFREDLFHRLNVIRIQVPPLRERREEIPALINHYLKLYQQEATKTDVQLSEEALDLMVIYEWPGNVRQLCNEVRRLVAYNESGTVVVPEALSSEIVNATRELPAEATHRKPGDVTVSGSGTLAEAVVEIERQMIQDALRRSSGNVAQAAKELGLSRKGLYLKMDRLQFKQ